MSSQILLSGIVKREEKHMSMFKNKLIALSLRQRSPELLIIQFLRCVIKFKLLAIILFVADVV